MPLTRCPICKNAKGDFGINRLGGLGTIWVIACSICGDYRITDQKLRDMVYEQKDPVKVSCFLRERSIHKQPLITITTEDFRNPDGVEYPHISIIEIENLFPKLISERLDRALINLSRLSNFAGAPINLNETDYAIFFPESSVSLQATFFIMGQLIRDQLLTGVLGFSTELTITNEGWKRIYDLEKGINIEYKQCFIAMWFDKSMEVISEHGYKKAVRDAGYEPMRIDDKQHNGKIDDQIIAEIRKSKFVVCDFTGHRGGVYFEAGFAMGLGLPVIWTCREDHMKEVHFDTRQYNHIVWKDENDLYTQLYNRIKATIV